jgi:hypothetical protein
MQWLGIMFMAALLAIIPGFGVAQQSKDKSPTSQSQGQGPEVKGETPGTAKSFTPEEKRSYEKETAKKLEAIQQKITDLRVKATTGSPQMKHTLMQTASRLQMQKSAAGNRLTALRKASDKDWGQQKADLDKAMADLRKALEAN